MAPCVAFWVDRHVVPKFTVYVLDSDGKDGPAGRKSGAQRKTGLVGERQLQPYAPHGAMRNNYYVTCDRVSFLKRPF